MLVVVRPQHSDGTEDLEALCTVFSHKENNKDSVIIQQSKSDMPGTTGEICGIILCSDHNDMLQDFFLVLKE